MVLTRRRGRVSIWGTPTHGRGRGWGHQWNRLRLDGRRWRVHIAPQIEGVKGRRRER